MDRKIFEGILKGATQAAEIAQGKRAPARAHRVKVPLSVDVKAIRHGLGMTQKEFSDTFGFPERTVKSWESKEREPEKSARILLRVIERFPATVIEATA